MKKVLLLLLITAASSPLFAQKVDSIYFHLYTDSLKKGTHNYINVDGKLSNGNWLPLTGKQIQFSASYGTFAGNELILPDTPTEEKVTVKAILKANPSVWIEKTIWIKKKPDGPLPTKDDMMNNAKPVNQKGKNKNR
jgi:hypothetical protein